MRSHGARVAEGQGAIDKRLAMLVVVFGKRDRVATSRESMTAVGRGSFSVTYIILVIRDS